jgi:hypothetical protein
MNYRCYRKKEKEFKRYGGKGIRVCVSLREATQNLIDAIGIRPKGHTVDRINGAMHYSCGRCRECKSNGWNKNIRWATPLQQARNRVNPVPCVKSKGKTLYISDIAKLMGVTPNSVRRRIKTNPRTALLPYRPTNKLVDVGVGKFTRRQIEERFGILQNTLKSRLGKGIKGKDLIAAAKGTGRHGSKRKQK